MPQNKMLLSRNFMLISLQIVFFVDSVMARKCFFSLFVLFFWMIVFITLLAEFLPLIFVCQICLFFLFIQFVCVVFYCFLGSPCQLMSCLALGIVLPQIFGFFWKILFILVPGQLMSCHNLLEVLQQTQEVDFFHELFLSLPRKIMMTFQKIFGEYNDDI